MVAICRRTDSTSIVAGVIGPHFHTAHHVDRGRPVSGGGSLERAPSGLGAATAAPLPMTGDPFPHPYGRLPPPPPAPTSPVPPPPRRRPSSAAPHPPPLTRHPVVAARRLPTLASAGHPLPPPHPACAPLLSPRAAPDARPCTPMVSPSPLLRAAALNGAAAVALGAFGAHGTCAGRGLVLGMG